jgi:hypothetical protein
MIPPSAVTFEPAGVRRLEPGGSASTKVTVGPLSEQAEGRYYGFVFVLGHADAVAHLVVDVGAQAEGQVGPDVGADTGADAGADSGSGDDPTLGS